MDGPAPLAARRSVDHASGLSVSACCYRGGTSMPGHVHAYPQLSISLLGSLSERSRSRSVGVVPACAAFKPAGFYHEVDFGAAGALQVSIDFDSCDEEILRGLDSWRVLRDEAARTAARSLFSQVLEDEPDRGMIEAVVLDLTALMTTGARWPRLGSPPPWLLRAREALIETDLSTAQIAADAGVHRVHLARTFPAYFGLTMSDYRRRGRLCRSALALALDAGSPSAAAAKFADQSHLTRVMRRELNVTPGQFGRAVWNRSLASTQ